MSSKCYNEQTILADGNVVRLTGSHAKYIGRVEVFDKTSNQWGTVCYNDVYYSYYLARFICRSLGYSDYRITRRGRDYPNITLSSNSPIITGRIQCAYSNYYYYRSHYKNYSLYHCSDFESNLGNAPSRCTSDEEWIVGCTCKCIFKIIYNVVK